MTKNVLISIDTAIIGHISGKKLQLTIIIKIEKQK